MDNRITQFTAFAIEESKTASSNRFGAAKDCHIRPNMPDRLQPVGLISIWATGLSIN